MRTGWLLSRASVAHGVAWPAQEEISASAKDLGRSSGSFWPGTEFERTVNSHGKRYRAR